MIEESSDKIEGNVQDIPCGSGSHMEEPIAAQLQSSSPENKYTPKVRKDYEIKKQREKWTDKEHQKFLEAVKLYKRDWRQIEKHVATKSAIQIRSHAQKFFAKVHRDSNTDSEVTLNPVEIPPPRPKKKPLHPYPRKAANPMKKENMNVTPDEQSLSPSDTKSPTSVLSANGSDTSGSPLSEPQRSSHLSPISCTTDMELSADPLLLENENECMTSSPFNKEGKGYHLELVQVTPPAMNIPVMEPEMLTLGLGCTHPVENAAADEAAKTIKLFGKTIMINQSKELSSSTTKDNEVILKDTALEELKVRNNKLVQNFPMVPNIEPKYTFGYIHGKFSPLSCSGPHFGIGGQSSDTGDVHGGMPLCGWFEGVVISQVPFGSNQMAVNSVVECVCRKTIQETKRKEEEPPHRGSSNGEVNELMTKIIGVESDAGTVAVAVDVEADAVEVDADAVEVDTDAASETLKKKSGRKKSCVGYKRCLSERDVTSPVVSVEERERRRARVC